MDRLHGPELTGKPRFWLAHAVHPRPHRDASLVCFDAFINDPTYLKYARVRFQPSRFLPERCDRYHHQQILILMSLSLIHELIQTYGLWMLFIGIMLECLGVPMPGETV